jgi:GAF domain-containing protein
LIIFNAMTHSNAIDSIQTLIDHQHDPDAVLSTVVSTVGQTLECDRCFLYLRYPDTRIGKITHCWLRSHQYPNLTDPDWKPEPENLPAEDPLFAAALRAEPSVFVEDVETADPRIVNLAFEQKNFGHRALVHAHLRQEGMLWGILQPCVFEQPRIWTEADRQFMTQMEQIITPIAISLVQTAVRERGEAMHSKS